MLLGLADILERSGASVSFSVSVDLHDLRFGNCYPVTEPVVAVGTVRNTAGVPVMSGTLGTTLHGVCDRCAADFARAVSFPIDAVIADEAECEDSEEEWVFPLEGDSVDLEDIVRTVFVLNMDSKLLCRPDCKGICCRCGKNLNDGPCGCRKEPDSRFAALRQLIE